MEEKISLAESQRQWQILLKRKMESDSVVPLPQHHHHNDTTTTTTTATSSSLSSKANNGCSKNENEQQEVVVVDDDDDDPFDCSDLCIPSAMGLVHETAALWIQEWKDLDQRKIIVGATTAPIIRTNESTKNQQNNNSNSATNDTSSAAREKDGAVATTTRKRPKWLDQHLRLPEGFDYATRQEGPPPDNDTTAGKKRMMKTTMMTNSEDRVLSLEDPTKTTSYHAELWKLFASIPTAKQLEQDAVGAGIRLPHSFRLMRTEMMDEKNKLKDMFGLCRLRMSDRHCYPAAAAAASPKAVALITSSSHQSLEEEQSSKPPPVAAGSSIVLECWRREPKRGSRPDSSRAVLEFLGSQTLYDVHCALIDLAEDEFWKQVVDDESTAAASTTATSNKQETDDESGMFFIENTFYTTGSVDYVTTIQQWLNEGNALKAKNRALNFGLDDKDPARPVRSMAETRLDELEMRLGVRYLHVHHGNVECSVFLVDRQYSCTGSAAAAASSFPLLHDVWTPTYTTPDCEACSTAAKASATGNGRGRPGSMVTSTECAMTDGHRALCLDCARQLAAASLTRATAASETATATATDTADSATTSQRKKPKLLLQPLTVWRSQADLSTDAYGDKGF